MVQHALYQFTKCYISKKVFYKPAAQNAKCYFIKMFLLHKFDDKRHNSSHMSRRRTNRVYLVIENKTRSLRYITESSTKAAAADDKVLKGT